jgi:hypothetical protein
MSKEYEMAAKRQPPAGDTATPATPASSPAAPDANPYKDSAAIVPEPPPRPATVPPKRFDDNPQVRPEDARMPQLRVMQGVSGAVGRGQAKPGDLLIDGGAPRQTMIVVPLKFNRSRRMGSGSGGNYLIECESPDGEEGFGSPGGECAVCPFSDPARKFPPPCDEVATFMVYGVEDGLIAAWELKRVARTNVSGTVLFLQQMFGFRNYAVAVHTQSQQSQFGTYFVPVVEKVDVPEEVLDRACAAIGLARTPRAQLAPPAERDADQDGVPF